MRSFGVAGGLQPGGAGEVTGARVGQRHVVLGRGGLFLLGLLLRCEPRGGERDQSLDGGEPEPVDPGGELLIHPPRALEGQGAGVGGDAAGLPRRHRQVLDERPEPGQPVPQVEGVGHQRHRRLGGDTHRGAQLLRHERATAGVPSPPKDASQSHSPGNPASPQVAVPDSSVAGCWAHHW